MKPWIKYLIYQVPGWVVAAVILISLRHWLGLPPWIAVGVFLLWVIKDIVLYPFLRKAFVAAGETPVDQMIGLQGVARERIDPRGYIHVRGELWRAEIRSGDTPIPAGSPVKIVDTYGMILIVAADVQH